MHGGIARSHRWVRFSLYALALLLSFWGALWLNVRSSEYWPASGYPEDPLELRWIAPCTLRFGDRVVIETTPESDGVRSVRFDSIETGRRHKHLYVDVDRRVTVTSGSSSFSEYTLSESPEYWVRYSNARTGRVEGNYGPFAWGETSMDELKHVDGKFIFFWDPWERTIERVDFPPEGPRCQTYQFPEEQLRTSGDVRWMGPDRLLVHSYVTGVPGPKGFEEVTRLEEEQVTAPNSQGVASQIIGLHRWHLFRWDNGQAIPLTQWDTLSEQHVGSVGERWIVLPAFRATVETRDYDGRILNEQEVSWRNPNTSLSSGGATMIVGTRSGLIGFLGNPGMQTGKPVDGLTLKPLSIPEDFPYLRDYEAERGRIVSSSPQGWSIAWNDPSIAPIRGNTPALQMGRPASQLRTACTGPWIVLYDPDEPLLFALVHTEQRAVHTIDLRWKRAAITFGAVAGSILFCLGWIVFSCRNRWPAWLDISMIGGLGVLTSCWIVQRVGASSALANEIAWCVILAWLFVACLWLVFGERSRLFRVANHMTILAGIVVLTAYPLGEFAYSSLPVEIVLVTIIDCILVGCLGGWLAKGFVQRGRVPPSRRLRITDILFLMTAMCLLWLSPILVTGEASLSWVIESLPDLGEMLAITVHEVYCVGCFFLSLPLLGRFRSPVRIGALIALAVFLTSTVFGLGLSFTEDLESVWFSLKAMVIAILMMVAMRAHGWTYRWRWAKDPTLPEVERY